MQSSSIRQYDTTRECCAIDIPRRSRKSNGKNSSEFEISTSEKKKSLPGEMTKSTNRFMSFVKFDFLWKQSNVSMPPILAGWRTVEEIQQHEFCIQKSTPPSATATTSAFVMITQTSVLAPRFNFHWISFRVLSSSATRGQLFRFVRRVNALVPLPSSTFLAAVVRLPVGGDCDH